MNIKDVFLNGNELAELCNNIIKGLISKSDLADTQQKQILEYVKQKEIHEQRFINELLMANQGTTFDYWANTLINYRDSKMIIEWLTKEPDKITSPPRKTLKPPPKPLTFEGLFIDKKNAQKVKDILKVNGYTENGCWRSESGNKSEPMYAYYALKPLFVNGKITPQAKVFLTEFRLREDHISDRQKTNEPDDYNMSDFKRIFYDLIPK